MIVAFVFERIHKYNSGLKIPSAKLTTSLAPGIDTITVNTIKQIANIIDSKLKDLKHRRKNSPGNIQRNKTLTNLNRKRECEEIVNFITDLLLYNR